MDPIGKDSGLRLIRLPKSDSQAAKDRLPVLDLNSSDPLADLLRDAPHRSQSKSAPSFNAAQRITAGGTMWLEGDTIMLPCPDCRAPMSVRLWLMVADCWRCGAGIELSEEQEREVEKLLARRKQMQQQAPAAPPITGEPPANGHRANGSPTGGQPATKPAAAPPVPPPVAAPPVAGAAKTAPAPAAPDSARPTSTTVVPSEETRPAALRPPPLRKSSPQTAPPTPPLARPGARRQPAGVRRRIQRITVANSPSAWLHKLLKSMPAWLISLLFHMVLIAFLSLFTIHNERKEPLIVLSAEWGHHDDGGHLPAKLVIDDVTFDLPLPNVEELKTDQQRAAVILADQEARELRLDPNDPTPNLPELVRVKEILGTSDAPRRMVAARDPRVRVELVTQEGGTTLSEAAVARSLRWMSQHQNRNGSWSLHAFHQAPDCKGRCRGAGSTRSDAAGTSLVLLPFLGAGQTHLAGQYRDEVSMGLRWLVESQLPNGDLRGKTTGNAGMYAHGQAAIVLCEAYAMTGDEALRDPAQRAINFIEAAQYNDGGWRYTPAVKGGRQVGDTSVLGWQIMALQSARAAGLDVQPATLEQAGHYLDQAAHNGGAQYSYMRGARGPTEVMSAEGLLCRMYLGWTRDQKGLTRGIDLLATKHLPVKSKPNIYYWYYATQVMHHAGGDPWERWNQKMRDLLIASQVTRGHEAGSWSPTRDRHDASGGRIYVTALSACTLEVYYRHAPIFRQIDLE